MFNSVNNLGSLFHFPAGALDEQRGNLTAAYGRVNPTHIYLNDRTVPTDYAVAQSSDLPGLRHFFTTDLGFAGNLTAIALRSDQYAVTLGAGGLPDIQHDIGGGGALSVTHDRTGAERLAVEQAWRGAPATTKFGRDDWHS